MTLSPPAVDLTAETTDFLTADERRSPQIQKFPKTHLRKSAPICGSNIPKLRGVHKISAPAFVSDLEILKTRIFGFRHSMSEFQEPLLLYHSTITAIPSSVV